jgi:sterol desaturase/sphingolipid hydroxylase (fatty acid hydroxylase superfamily)
MSMLSFEHSKAAYLADFWLYGTCTLVLMSHLAWSAPTPLRWALTLCVCLGVLTWSAMEYVLHRFVLHQFPVFRIWHEVHHARPRALICTPTFLSALLIGALVFLPLYLLMDRWLAQGITLGVLLGYLGYAVTHHAIHHWRAGNAWLEGRRHWHAMHHRPHPRSACFGVTSGFWDWVFRSD